MPTEEAPEQGQIAVRGAVLSDAVRWVAEDGAVVVQSTEFDLTDIGSDWESALTSFVDSAVELFGTWAQLDANELTEYERRSATLLSIRLLEFLAQWKDLLEAELEEASLRRPSLIDALSFGRRRAIRQRPQNWHPQAQSSSKQPLRV